MPALNQLEPTCNPFVRQPVQGSPLQPVPPLRPTTAEIPAIRCRCGRRVSLLPLREAAQNRFPVRLHSTTAENPAIRCRCGRRVSLLPLREAAQSRFPVRLRSTTAENPAIRCRCGRPLTVVERPVSVLPRFSPPVGMSTGRQNVSDRKELSMRRGTIRRAKIRTPRRGQWDAFGRLAQ